MADKDILSSDGFFFQSLSRSFPSSCLPVHPETILFGVVPQFSFDFNSDSIKKTKPSSETFEV